MLSVYLRDLVWPPLSIILNRVKSYSGYVAKTKSMDPNLDGSGPAILMEFIFGLPHQSCQQPFDWSSNRQCETATSAVNAEIITLLELVQHVYVWRTCWLPEVNPDGLKIWCDNKGTAVICGFVALDWTKCKATTSSSKKFVEWLLLMLIQWFTKFSESKGHFELFRDVWWT